MCRKCLIWRSKSFLMAWFDIHGVAELIRSNKILFSHCMNFNFFFLHPILLILGTYFRVFAQVSILLCRIIFDMLFNMIALSWAMVRFLSSISLNFLIFGLLERPFAYEWGHLLSTVDCTLRSLSRIHLFSFIFPLA